jgi:hypothetical protein
MRTTLDLDERVIHAARAKAAADGVSLGRAVSDLVLEVIQQPVPAAPGLRVLPATPGHLITDELVKAHQDEE